MKHMRDDVDCDVCDVRAELRACESCGVTMMVTDCGHRSQPRPIAADETGATVCDGCYATRVRRD